MTVQGTVRLPQRFTLDSIFMDLMKSEKARQVLAPLLEGMKESFGAAGEEGRSEAAESAISADMLQAMLQYSPLRSVLSFAPGKVSYEQLEGIVAQLNQEA